MVDKVEEFAPAKINLYLHVTGKRADGYHFLDSLIGFASIGDWIQVEADKDFSFRMEGPFGHLLEPSGDNLVLRAAEGLQKLLDVKKGARITLVKNLPIASGIGGGSSDAAATIRALLKLWAIPVPRKEISSFALSLGADVPVCLERRTSFFSGIGEIVEPAPALPAWYVILVNPLIGSKTMETFRLLRPPYSSGNLPPYRPKDSKEALASLRARKNDLETPAKKSLPVIDEMLSAIHATKDCSLARMSGSGATCFGIYETAEAAHAGSSRIKTDYPGWWVEQGVFLNEPLE